MKLHMGIKVRVLSVRVIGLRWGFRVKILSVRVLRIRVRVRILRVTDKQCAWCGVISGVQC